MEQALAEAPRILMGLFAIMNPIANTPIFIGLTDSDDASVRRAIAARSLVLALLIVSAFCIGGQLIFELFGITLPAFRITGGILIFLIGFHMLQGRHSPVQATDANSAPTDRRTQLSVAVSPLAMPILAGPGTIATAMGYAAGAAGAAVTVACFAVVCLATYLFFVFGERLVHFIGPEAINVVTRMMGLILAVIGTEMTIVGIRGAFGLAG